MKRIVYLLLIVTGVLPNLTHAQGVARTDSITRYFYGNGKVSSEGFLRDGKPDGYWKTYYENGKIKAEGNRLNFELDSLWRFYNEEGNLILEINYHAGKKNGLRKTYREGEMVVETFVKDIKQGPTTYYFADNKIKMIVPFVNGVEQGFAKEFDKEGNVIGIVEYKKGYIVSRENINRRDKAGLKQGNWKSFWESGNLKMEVTYRDDKKNGYLKEYDRMGKLLNVSKYIDDELQEGAEEVAKFDILTDYYPNGTPKIVASYKNKVPEGIRREYDESGKIIKGFVYKKGIKTGEGITDEQGLKQGPWKEYYDDGRLQGEGNYKDGNHVGSWKYYYPEGKTELIGNYSKTGKAEGTWKWFHENGELKREETFSRGLSDGPMVEYDETGKVLAQGEYVDGQEQGNWIYQMGDYREEGSFVNGMKDGLWKYYYADGTLEFEGKFVEDMPDGKQVYYWDNGKRKDEGYYVMGKREGEWYKYNIDGTIFLVISYKDDIERKFDGVKIVPDVNE